MTDDTMTGPARALYQRYLAAWNGRDFAGVAACFTEPAFYVLPGASVALPDRDSFVSLLKKVFAGPEAQGFDRTEVGKITAAPCGADMAVVDARDVARLCRDGTVIETIDGHYVICKQDGDWRFTLAVTCAPGWRDA